MKKLVLFIVTGSLFTGCAAIPDHWQGAGGHPVRRSLAPGVRELSAGDTAASVKALKRASEGKAVSGVTDEVLFRLALLSLKPNRETLVSRRGRHLLKRLKKEYPSSPWTAQAAQLFELIKLVDELYLQNKEVTAAKESLSKEVEVLKHNIQQSKNLDMELEKSR